MVKFFRLVFVAILLFLSSVNAQQISVNATTDTTVYKVGDYIKYQIEVTCEKYISIHVPSIKDSVKVLEFISALPPEKTEANSKTVERYTFVFSKYDSAKVTIPPIAIGYTQGRNTSLLYIKTNPVTITVKTLLVNTQEDIRDVKDPLKLPMNWLLIIVIIIFIALLTVAVYILYKRYKKKKAQKENILPEIKIPPHEIALMKLSELEQKKLWQNGMIKQYHSEVTEIVRQYFEDRFNFRALEMPSSEILPVLSVIEEGKKIVDISGKFFSNADLVKFAKFEPMPKVNEEMMKQAFDIVNSTIPLPPQNVSEEQNV